ncbi:MAG TPA: YncE family protein [Pyrinomonadaceae bacterium]|jgi:YVTN family beta-propeller protein|nr:YncE family protein [Pyrinomonadaceae bacterium]
MKHTIGSLDTKRHEQFMAMVYFACFLVLFFAAAAVKAQEPAQPPIPKLEPANSLSKVPTRSQKVVQQGIAIEFTVDPSAKDVTKIRAGEDTNIKFKVTDTTTGTPVKGLNLSAWLSLREGEKAPEGAQCREKIQSYLTGSMRARPDVDLNSYYILALNKSADISVIDPLLGFGGSKLLTLVMMKSPGEDWVLTKDRETLFVTLPAINQVAVIDTRNWKVASYIDTGVKPTSITLQPDQKYVWIGHEGSQPAASGVTVLDTGTLRVAAQISTGAGRHDTVVSNDNRFAFVSNRDGGTVSIVDVRKLKKITDVMVGPGPVSLALSELSKAIYAASENDGSIAVIDEQGQILTRMKAKPGSRLIRITPDGRYGFVLNTNESTVSIFDAASNRVLHTVKVGKAPDQVVFSDTFAFIRSLETESVAMIRLSTIGTEVDITDFPGGQGIPATASTPIRADSIVLAPEGNAVVLANPADKVLYYYTEGMAAPMGNFQNYRREPLAVLIVDRSLRETTPGVYSTTVKLPASGNYDVAFLTDSPRIAYCFETAADPNPRLQEERTVALRIEPQIKDTNLSVGKDFRLRFKLIETSTNKVKDNLEDVRVLTFLAPGTWQRRDVAKSLGQGIYEINLNIPEAGVYMVFVESASMGVRYKDLPHLTLEAKDLEHE